MYILLLIDFQRYSSTFGVSWEWRGTITTSPKSVTTRRVSRSSEAELRQQRSRFRTKKRRLCKIWWKAGELLTDSDASDRSSHNGFEIFVPARQWRQHDNSLEPRPHAAGDARETGEGRQREASTSEGKRKELAANGTVGKSILLPTVRTRHGADELHAASELGSRFQTTVLGHLQIARRRHGKQTQSGRHAGSTFEWADAE